MIDLTNEPRPGWTPNRVAVAKELWLDGSSAAEIAQAVGGLLSRNAVIGKIHRLGLAGRVAASHPHANTGAKARGKPAERKVRAPRKISAAANGQMRRVANRADAPKPEPFIDKTLRADERGTVALLQLGAHMCKWPCGDPASEGFAFCGALIGGDGPYCTSHAARAYQPSQTKADARDLRRLLRRFG